MKSRTERKTTGHDARMVRRPSFDDADGALPSDSSRSSNGAPADPPGVVDEFAEEERQRRAVKHAAAAEAHATKNVERAHGIMLAAVVASKAEPTCDVKARAALRATIELNVAACTLAYARRALLEAQGVNTDAA